MSRKHHGGPAPIPPGNQPANGPAGNADLGQGETSGPKSQEQDVKRRLGDYTGAGEHSIQQPSDLNDGTKHSR